MQNLPAQTVRVSEKSFALLIFACKTEMSKKNFEFLEIIGQGGFGKVSLRVTQLLVPFYLTISNLIGLARRVSEDKADLCYERNAESARNLQTQRKVGHEREKVARKAAPSLPGQHELCVLGL